MDSETETLQWGIAAAPPAEAAGPPSSSWPALRVSCDLSREVVGTLPMPVDLVLYQGDDFQLTLEVTDLDDQPADLTGHEAAAQIRVTPTSSVAIADFDATIVANVITLHLPNREAARVPASSVWDCQITDANGWITTLVAGMVATMPQVTR